MDHLQLYALRDLIAISEKGGEKFVKGLETTLARYDKHITQECLVRTRRQGPPFVVDSTQALTYAAAPCPQRNPRVCALEQHCQARGHMCEFCSSSEILFPFQVETTRQCSACQSYFHSECYRKMQSSKQTCPKCARIAAVRDRKKRRAEAEPAADRHSAD